MIDDEDDGIDLKPRRLNWWGVGSTFTNWVAQMFIQTGNAFQEFSEDLASHAIWQNQQQDFAADVAKFIETLPVIEAPQE